MSVDRVVVFIFNTVFITLLILLFLTLKLVGIGEVATWSWLLVISVPLIGGFILSFLIILLTILIPLKLFT
jgi:hypothetical protein